MFGLDAAAFGIPETDTSEGSEEVLAALRGGASQETLALIDELKHPSKSSWVAQLGLLAVSLLLFVSLGLVAWSPAEVVLLVIVLFVHESGHYLAMRLFGYRDVKMFFIPLFGAAASGHGDNAPGSQRTLVALAGPIPGILLGVALASVYLVTGRPLVGDVAKMFLFLNGFNLLPVLPLDGGHVMQETVFGRSRWLEVAFQVVAAACLLLLAVSLSVPVLAVIGVLMLMGLPRLLKVGRVVNRLEHADEPLPAGSLREAPLAFLVRTVNEMDVEFGGEHRPKVRQALLEAVLEKLGRRPPGAGATLGLLVAYAASFIFALLGGILIIVKNMPPQQLH